MTTLGQAAPSLRSDLTVARAGLEFYPSLLAGTGIGYEATNRYGVGGSIRFNFGIGVASDDLVSAKAASWRWNFSKSTSPLGGLFNSDNGMGFLLSSKTGFYRDVVDYTHPRETFSESLGLRVVLGNAGMHFLTGFDVPVTNPKHALVYAGLHLLFLNLEFGYDLENFKDEERQRRASMPNSSPSGSTTIALNWNF